LLAEKANSRASRSAATAQPPAGEAQRVIAGTVEQGRRVAVGDPAGWFSTCRVHAEGLRRSG
jgi:hypothetical protein